MRRLNAFVVGGDMFSQSVMHRCAVADAVILFEEASTKSWVSEWVGTFGKFAQPATFHALNDFEKIQIRQKDTLEYNLEVQFAG